MRKSWIIGGLVIAALAGAASGWLSTPPPGKPVEATATIAEPAAPPAATPQAEPAPPAAESPAPAVAALPPLPTRTIPEWRTHAVPEDEVPPAPKQLDLRMPSTGSAAAPAPAFRPFASLQPQTPPGGAAPVPGPPGGTGPQIAGAAQAEGATALRVGGRPLHLFGIRPPTTGDRCAEPGIPAPGSGTQARRTLPCLEQAQGVLAARLRGRTNVSCRFPGTSRQDSPAICLDGDGVDLAGVLVAEGLALADPAQSFDYVGAEGVARSQKRGLWLFR
jgi:endonuclease YncB( thermonuclease family)